MAHSSATAKNAPATLKSPTFLASKKSIRCPTPARRESAKTKTTAMSLESRSFCRFTGIVRLNLCEPAEQVSVLHRADGFGFNVDDSIKEQFAIQNRSGCTEGFSELGKVLQPLGSIANKCTETLFTADLA